MAISSTVAVSIGLKSFPIEEALRRRKFRTLLHSHYFDNYQVEGEGESTSVEFFKGPVPDESPRLLKCTSSNLIFLIRDYDITLVNKNHFVSDFENVAKALSGFDIVAADVAFLDVREEIGDTAVGPHALKRYAHLILAPEVAASFGSPSDLTAEVDIRRTIDKYYMHVIVVRLRNVSEEQTWTWFSGYAATQAEAWLGKSIPDALGALARDYFETDIHRNNVEIYKRIAKYDSSEGE